LKLNLRYMEGYINVLEGHARVPGEVPGMALDSYVTSMYLTAPGTLAWPWTPI
jgi:hypothetical protein